MKPHGTPARALMHYRDGETPCEPCREAREAARKERNKTYVEPESTREARRRHNRIRNAAVRQLIAAHYPEYLRILTELREQT